METKTTSGKQIDLLIVFYDLHTKLFHNVVEGLSDNDAQNRLNTKANHIAWLTGSLVHERFELANATDIELKQTSHELYEGHKGIQDNITYPSLAEFKKDWDHITPVLRNKLLHLTEDELNSPDPYGMPENDLTFFDAVTFLVDRESYCIGQIGLWRRLLGYEAMKYQ